MHHHQQDVIVRHRAARSPPGTPARTARSTRSCDIDRSRLDRPIDSVRPHRHRPASHHLDRRARPADRSPAGPPRPIDHHPSPQRLVPTHQADQRPPHRRHIERTPQPHADRHVVHRRVRHELLEEPHPLLRERQAQRLRPIHRHAAADAPTPRRQPASTTAANAATVGASNTARTATSTPNRVPHPRHHPRRQQRMPTQLEEVVARPRPRSPPTPRAQIAATTALRSRSAAPRTRPVRLTTGVRRGQRVAVDLAVRGQRELRRGRRTPTGTM